MKLPKHFLQNNIKKLVEPSIKPIYTPLNDDQYNQLAIKPDNSILGTENIGGTLIGNTVAIGLIGLTIDLLPTVHEIASCIGADN